MSLLRFERDKVDEQLEEILGVLNPVTERPLPPSLTAIDPHVYRWQALVPRLEDRIGDLPVDLSSPSERGWHSCTLMKDRYLVVFGGLAFRRFATPQPFSTLHTMPADHELFNDIHIYDSLDLCWTAPRLDRKPAGRYGHLAIALDEDSLLVFGGRGSRGVYLHDTWIFSLSQSQWTDVSSSSALHPSARAFSAGVSARRRGFLFGGTNGEENFCDVWSFGRAEVRWEREVMGGLFPSPRYGHAMLKVSESKCLVIGGCAVSPVSEIRGATELSSGLQLLATSTEDNAIHSSLIATDNVNALQVRCILMLIYS